MIQAKYKSYPAYKPSGMEWIWEIPEGWAVRRLRFAVKYNLKTLSENSTNPNYEIEYLDIGNVDSDGNIFTTEKILFRDAPSRARRIVTKQNTIISTVRTYLKAIGYLEDIPGNLIVSTGFAVIQCAENSDTKYFYYFFRSQYFIEQVVKNSKGVGYPAITPSQSPSNLIDIPLLIPPLPEQKAVADFLDRDTARINGIVEKQTQMIELLKEKRSALITSAVTKGLDPNVKLKPSGVEWLGEIPEGWETTNLKRALSQKITDGPHETPELIPDGIPFISAEAIKNNKIDFDLRRGNISLQLHEEYCKKAKPKLHDIFFIKSGATTGNIAFVETNEEFSIWSPLALIRCANDKLFYKYLFYLMLSNEFRKQVELSWSFGTQQNIGMGVVGRLIIILPPLPEQQAIADFLDCETAKIDTLIEKIERQIELLNEYRQSLITSAVTGKIDLRGTL